MNDRNDNISDDTNFILKLTGLVLRWRRLLIVNSIVAAILTFALMILFFPNWFTAATSIMPPEKDFGSLSVASGMLPSGLTSLLSGSGLALPGLASPSDLYAAILHSRTVSMAVIEEHDLKGVFGTKLDSDALLELRSRTSVRVNPEGIIILSYTDTDPWRAAVVANSFVEELNRVNQENLVSKAKAMREFIEKRLNESIVDLTTAEENLEAFQKDHNAVALDEQVKAAINAIADLRGQLVIAEIELGVMKRSLSPDNMKYKNQQYKIQQIKEQLEKLEKGDTAHPDSSVLNVPMSQAPELGLAYARLMRELKIQEKIFELLKQQYEQARIQEMRDTPTVQVLDPARAPEKKSGPHRVMTAAMAAVMSFGLTLFLVIGLEFVEKEKEKDSIIYRRIYGFGRMLNEDIYWIRSLFRRKSRDDAG
jgi:tyrosine-protein kinase Etk/Wzc